MPLVRSPSKQRKNRALHVEARTRSPTRGRVADTTPRVFIDNNLSRSAVLGKENRDRSQLLGQKRKLDILEDHPEDSVATPLRALPVSRKKHKANVPKRTPVTTPRVSIERNRNSSSDTREKRKSARTSRDISSELHTSHPTTETEFTHKTPPTRRKALTDVDSLQEKMGTEGFTEKVAELQMEIELFQKAVQDQQKALDDLKSGLVASKKRNRKQEREIGKLKSVNKKVEDRLNTVQEDLACQICLDMLSKPHTLNPCGHVFCQGCLQNWFRSAPRIKYGDRILDNIPIACRRKHCPYCRSDIRSRPIPLFILNNVLSAIASRDQPASDDVSSNGDPWKGIFREEFKDTTDRSSVYSDSDDDDDSDDLEEDVGHNLFSIERRDFGGIGSGHRDEQSEGDSSSDSSSSEGSFGDSSSDDGSSSNTSSSDSSSSDSSSSDDSDFFTDMRPPSYAPPRYRSEMTRHMYPDVSQEHLQLLRRGATLPMIERYRMRFDEDEGIVAWVSDVTEVYLGWNIMISFYDFPDGRNFMTLLERDTADRPRNWTLEFAEGHLVFQRLVPSHLRHEVLYYRNESESESDESDRDDVIE